MPKSVLFTTEQLNSIYDAVFRKSTAQPGYYAQDFGNEIDSKTFRKVMVELKNGLSKLCEQQAGKKLHYQVFGRFNHQSSSRFHRDSAVDHSFLMLGYEPTIVDSKVYVADYSKYIESENISLKTFFNSDRNENVINNDLLLSQHTTELSPFPINNYRLLLLNNSKSFDEQTYGVFHRAEIPQKIEGEDRVLNYMMLGLGEHKIEHDEKSLFNFIHTEKVDR